MDKMVAALEKKRDDAPVREFAFSMGMHPSTYYRLLKGERGIGARLLLRILRHYPDLALVFLSKISPNGD